MIRFYFLMASLSLASIANAAVWPGLIGSGTQDDPYQISSPADFAIIAENISNENTGVGEYFLMTSDVDFGGNESTPVQLPAIGKEGVTNISTVEWGFEGTFDGNNHTVKGIYHTSNANDRAGQFNALFASLGTDGVIKNLTFSDDNHVASYNYVAPFVSVAKGKIINCVNESDITASNAFAGGICGYLVAGTGEITGCVNDGNISAMTFAAGIVGGSQSGAAVESYEGYVVSDCSNNGNISTLNGTGSAGIAGSYSGILTGCTNYGTIDDTAKAGQYTAGIVSSASYLIELSECDNYGNVAGTKNVAGICGMIMKANDAEITVTYCTNNGEVTATEGNVAGIVANTLRSDDMVTIANCSNNAEISISDAETDLIGNLRGSWAIALGEGNEIAEGLTRYALDPEQQDDNNGDDNNGDDDNNGSTDSVEGINADEQGLKDGKYNFDGTIVIIRNGNAYNVHGQAMKSEAFNPAR